MKTQIALFIIVLALFSSCGDLTKKQTKPVENWTYSEPEDKMTGEKTFYAECNSTNKIEFEFPYEGGSTFKLVVRNLNDGNEVILSVSKGQFMPSFIDEEYCRIKFDDGETLDYYYVSAASGSADLIFLQEADKLIAALKSAKKVKIEAPFFQAGRKIIEFDVEGLEWDK
ncbi:MAG: hypothetical protein PHE56_15895 [Bacteroidales bacterium]|nr:hypothetical protein [Bacteroidales bacterium]